MPHFLPANEMLQRTSFEEPTSPRVVCSPDLGKFFASFTFNIDDVTEHLLRNGLTPEQIGNYVIRFDSVSCEANESPAYGVYIMGSAQATIFVGSFVDHFQEVVKASGIAHVSGSTKGLIESMMAGDIAEAVWHETQHFIQDTLKTDRVAELYRKGFLGRLLGSILAIFDGTAEFQADAAALLAPNDCLKVGIKQLEHDGYPKKLVPQEAKKRASTPI